VKQQGCETHHPLHIVPQNPFLAYPRTYFSTICLLEIDKNKSREICKICKGEFLGTKIL
jgi:hypothetical protein